MAYSRVKSPAAQNVVASVIVALGPGIYVAITILGAGGGPSNAVTMINAANSTLYGVYFIVGLFSGFVVTVLGPKYTLMFGSLGYPVFVGGLWYFTNSGKLGYPIFGGAFLGLTACLLWTAASFIAFSYPDENRKGRYIAMQWGMLSVGSTTASLIAFGINYQAAVQQVPLAVYIVFIVLMISAVVIACLFIESPTSVRKLDGSLVRDYPHRGVSNELKGQLRLLSDWRMLALMIPFFASEIAIIIISTLNGLYFNIRTRSLNSVMFNLMQAIGAVFIIFFLDSRGIGGQRMRGLVSIAVVSSIIVPGWIGLIIWLSRNPLDPVSPPLWDWTDSEFGWFFVLDLIFGANMVIYQVVAQWIASSLTKDLETLARYAGFAKGCLAGGLACAFGIEAAGLSQLHVVAFLFSLQGVGLVCMAFVCWLCLQQRSMDSDHIVTV